jgi:TRAP-type mannitol/chloroaromatic compound transport system permease small subunit
MSVTPGSNVLERAGRALTQLSAWPGRAGSWLIIPMMVGVFLAVIGAVMRIQVIFDWGTPIPLFGNDLSIIDLNELQWHFFAAMVMLAGAFTFAEDNHVRVDIFYSKLSPRGKAVVNLVGDLLFLLPFCALIGWLSIRFVNMALISGERSDYGGLSHRWVVKALLPVGLGLLFAAGLGRVLQSIGILLNPNSAAPSREVGNV